MVMVWSQLIQQLTGICFGCVTAAVSHRIRSCTWGKLLRFGQVWVLCGGVFAVGVRFLLGHLLNWYWQFVKMVSETSFARSRLVHRDIYVYLSFLLAWIVAFVACVICDVWFLVLGWRCPCRTLFEYVRHWREWKARCIVTAKLQIGMFIFNANLWLTLRYAWTFHECEWWSLIAPSQKHKLGNTTFVIAPLSIIGYVRSDRHFG